MLATAPPAHHRHHHAHPVRITTRVGTAVLVASPSAPVVVILTVPAPDPFAVVQQIAGNAGNGLCGMPPGECQAPGAMPPGEQGIQNDPNYDPNFAGKSTVAH